MAGHGVSYEHRKREGRLPGDARRAVCKKGTAVLQNNIFRCIEKRGIGMNTSMKKSMSNAVWAEKSALSNLRFQVRNFLRSAVETADPDVFYFSLNGMVMPLSHRA